MKEIKSKGVFFVCVMLLIPTISFATFDSNVKANIPSTEIDTNYVYNITQNLSKIVITYQEDGLDKGRAFATEGEREAALKIQREMMNNLSLIDPFGNPSNPHLQQIRNLAFPSFSKYPFTIHGGALRKKIKINSRNLTFYNVQQESNTYIEEFFISPRWNLTGQYLFNSSYRMGKLWQDYPKLSHTFTENYLNIKTAVPTFDDWLLDFFDNHTSDFCNYTLSFINDEISSDLSFWTDIFVPKFEEFYDYNIDSINVIDNETYPSFYRDIEPETDEFVYMEEDPQYNPDSNLTSILQIMQNRLRDLFNDTYWAIFESRLSYFPNVFPIIRETMYTLWFKFVTNNILSIFSSQWAQFKTVLLLKMQPKWRGFIRYDFHPHAYDMNYVPYRAMPIIWINKTAGEPIYNSYSNYRVNYSIEQEHTNLAESYNVVGQINGKDQSKTMIISCLYDSWWNQGTADSAIGMGIVMGIAKYMKELTQPPYNLVPKYNIKFIAFSGEEYHLRGAHYYQQTHNKNEDIVMVLDLNQLGFKQADDRGELDPDHTMHVMTNFCLNGRFLEEVCNITNYEERLSDSRTHMGEIEYDRKTVSPSNTRAFMLPSTNDATTVVLFLKEKDYWTMHHRDGESHTEGDVMDYFYWDDVNLTAEMIWNTTKLYALDPNSWFSDFSFVEWDDDDGDTFPDTINASVKMKTIMPRDHVVLKGSLHHVNYQLNNIGPEIQTKEYVIERGEEISDYMNFTLDEPGAMGSYICTVNCFNSTGDVLNKVFNKFDLPAIWEIFANQTDYQLKVYITPFDASPSVTSQPTSTVTSNPKAGTQYPYTTSTTDPEGDQIYYQWAYTNNATGTTTYGPWLGPYQSGQNCTTNHMWTETGNMHVKVRARDDSHSPNIISNWSSPLNLILQKGVRIVGPDKVLVNQSFNVTGYAYGYTPQNITWTFDQSEGGTKYQAEANYTYGNKVNQTVNLSIKYNDTIWFSIENTVEVVSLVPKINVSSYYAKPGENITFTNISEAEFTITNVSWNFGDGNNSTTSSINHSYTNPGSYNVTLTVNDSKYTTDTITINVYIDDVKPEVLSAICYPETVNVSSVFESEPIGPICYGQNLTFNVDFLDNISGIDTASVYVVYEDGSSGNYTLSPSNHTTYDYEYTYTNTSRTGNYYYYIWACDKSNNSNVSQWYRFYIYDQFGSSSPGQFNQTIDDRISGTTFTINATATADSITSYIQANESTPPKVKCIIYRTNDSTLIGTTEEKNVTTGEDFSWVTFNFTGTKPTLTDNTSYVLSCWSDDMCYLRYDIANTSIGRYAAINYAVNPPDPISWDGNETRRYSIYCSYTTLPEITSVSASPSTVGFGANVTISADVTDTSLLESVKVNISYPDDSYEKITMSNTAGDTYQYVFSDTWLTGQFNYTIWATDVLGTMNSSSGHSFNLSVNATISVCTIKDSYNGSEALNITDPPGPESEIGYKLLDGGDTLKIWNQYDDYYIDTESGIQLTNHKDEYWSQNVMMLGYYNNDQWNLMYRTDELTNFTQDVVSDNQSYVNVTFWKNLEYNGYQFRLAIRYHLGGNDNTLTVIPYIKNLGSSIPYTLGFGWELKDIQINMTTINDYIEVNGTSYYLNTSLNNTYTNLSRPIEWYNETTNTTEIIGWIPRPYFYIKENTSVGAESLYLAWNESLTYKLQVKSRNGQYNAPVTLFIRIGTLAQNQEKYTELQWYDASETTYYFDSWDETEEWTTNPGRMVNGEEASYASTPTDGDIELCNDNSYSSGGQGTISKVEIRTYAYDNCNSNLYLRPVFGGSRDGQNYTYAPPNSKAAWSQWYDITNDEYAPGTWTWSEVSNLDCDVEAELPSSFPPPTVYCSEIELRVTYTIDFTPSISNPYPADDASGISLTPVLNITVNDANGDSMNITWLSNSSDGETWQVFGTNNSVSNGTYHQVFSNATENGKWWYWMVNVTDGTNYNFSDAYRFYTGNQSKIVNTGNSVFKGYLLIQVQYYNQTSGNWTVADDTINETTLRTWLASEGPYGSHLLGLDTVFNGNVSTSDLSSFGNGTYRIYAALRDPKYTVLELDGGAKIEATYEFTITFS